jgi:phosphomannomutase
MSFPCFKAYDIRGKVPNELNENLAYRIGRSYSEFLKPNKIVVGYDIRNSSLSLSNSLIKGLNDSGVDVLNIGLCGTEEMYFATSTLKLDGGIMITASHNEKDENGMKLVREDAMPISIDNGLETIHQSVSANIFRPSTHKGSFEYNLSKEKYISELLSYINTEYLNPLKIAINAGNSSASLIIDKLAKHLPFKFIRINWEPNGEFPNGIPNPLIKKNQKITSEAVIENGADLGIAFDGDFDRCFFFDENGSFIEGYYMVGLIAEIILGKYPSNSKIISDPRLIWNTIDIVKAKGGIPIINKAGHSFIKTRMRTENAVYAGEISGHHYFREFSYCDSGMIPWLLISEQLSTCLKPLSELVCRRIKLFPSSGELNFEVGNPLGKMQEIKDAYTNGNPRFDFSDGISIEFPEWRFNLRNSNTEPRLRLNIETRGNLELLHNKTKELCEIISRDN